jgi:hypothetical protein
MKSLLLTAAVSALALGANAQISIIPEAGVNLANIRSTVAGEKSTSSTKAGFRGGVNLGIGFGDHLSIQPGVFFAQKGGSQETMGVTVQNVINYVEIPVNVVYYFMEDQSGFFLNAGAYAAAAVTGYLKVGDEKADLNIGGNETDDIRRWDIGFQGGAGYQTKMGLMFRAQYMLGAMNIANHDNSDNAARNGAINLSLGYKFGW